ncbi:PKD domain-containing protein [Granulosicoccaceae sp. 1_MG-2023]|nr:PKD domain-containing protein [Granulosicoccaceae sp. 1_MG-2023]
MLTTRHTLFLCALITALTACGGGGGGEPNTTPVADAGGDQIVNAGEIVTLDGSLSFDADGDELDYFWSLDTIAAGSPVLLYNEQSRQANLANTRVGEYTLRLTVTDGKDSDSTTVAISVSNLYGQAPVREPVRPEVEWLAESAAKLIEETLGEPDDFKQLDAPTWISPTPDNPNIGLLSFTISPKLINDTTSGSGTKVLCFAEWDGDGYWTNLIFDDGSSIAPGQSAIDEGVFTGVDSLDGLDVDLYCTWLER